MKYNDYDIIFDDENIIGESWEIERYLKDQLKEHDEECESLAKELLEDLKRHDGYVCCVYHPMGAYTIYDLYIKTNEKEYEELW